MVASRTFPVNMLKVCWFSTLRELGYSTTLSLHNPTSTLPNIDQSFQLAIDLFSVQGELIESGIEIGVLESGERFQIDIEEILQMLKIEDDIVGVLHQTPQSLAGLDFVPFDMNAITKWTVATDDFIGYRHLKSGLQSGVHYQSPPMNDSRVQSSGITIMQSPKVLVSPDTDTKLLCLAPSSDSDFRGSIDFHLAILDQNGKIHGRTSLSIPARGRALVSVTELLRDHHSLSDFLELGGFGMLVGLATNGALIPLALAINQSGGLAIDHSLPPSYYIPWWGGAPKREAAESLTNRLFPGVSA